MTLRRLWLRLAWGANVAEEDESGEDARRKRHKTIRLGERVRRRLVLQTEVTVFVLLHDGRALDGDSRGDQGFVDEHSMSVRERTIGLLVNSGCLFIFTSIISLHRERSFMQIGTHTISIYMPIDQDSIFREKEYGHTSPPPSLPPSLTQIYLYITNK